MARSGSASGAEVRVARLDGDARGVQDDPAVIVPGVLPGELVRIGVAHVDRRGRTFGVLDEVLEASPDRVESPCPHFLSCGGCDLLHAKTRAQHAFKRQRVADVLGFGSVEAVVASPRPRGYRALAKWVVSGSVLGSYAPRSHDVVDMSGCIVHAPEAERIGDAIRAELPVDSLRYVLVRASLLENRAIVVLVVTRAGAGAALARVLGAREDVAAVYEHVNTSSGDELLGSGEFMPLVEKSEVFEKIGDTKYRLRPGAFAQVNPLAAALLYDRAVELAAPSGMRILDLYSGSGGIALAAVGRGAARVVAVEESPAAVAAARESGLTEVVEATAEEGVVTKDAFDVVILNPPRKGASPAVRAGILQLAPKRIVYVSCNPETLARDVGDFSSRYELARVIPVDLFPGTKHVETVALLTARAAR